MLSGPSHLQCPACGHVFMSAQSRPDASETCPHCASVGPLAHFRVIAQSHAAEPVRFQKRMPRAPEPALVQTPPPSPVAALEAHVPHMSHPTHLPRMTPAQWPGLGAESAGQGNPQISESIIEPQKKSSVLYWTTVTLVFIAVCTVIGLLAWEKINHRLQQLRADKIAKASAPAVSAGRLPVPALRVDPMEELNQRVLTGAAMADADRLIKVLFNSATSADRLKAIARPREFQSEVAAMFDESPAKPALVALTPITNPTLSLLTHERLPMFKVVTTLNKSGALIRTTSGDSGEAVIDWPLFRETHDGLLARHIEGKSQEPRWFHVGLRRSHSFELPKDISGEFDAIDIDGSTDGSGRVVTYVARESPLGRHLTRNIEWNKFYFGRVLVSWMDIAGEMRPALLDCEGSALPEKDDTKPATGH